MIRLLPIVKINDKYYYNDMRLRQYRNITDPFDWIEYEECNDKVEEITGYIDIPKSVKDS